jgi:hypothetical protein
MSRSATLPAPFGMLEPFAEYWAAPTLSLRDTRRLESGPEQRLVFYHAVKDLAPAMLDYLDGKAFSAYDEADHRLMDLMSSLIHLSLAVEVEGNEEHLHAQGSWKMPIVRERKGPREIRSEPI